MSFHHVQGKAVVARWLRQTVRAETQVAIEQGIDTQSRRIADVLLTSPDGGSRMAFEVQYSALTPSVWRQRHEDYRRAGIVDVWLFGHTQLRQAEGRQVEARFELAPVHQAVLHAGLPLFFLNPDLGQVAVAADRGPANGEVVLARVQPYELRRVLLVAFDLSAASAVRDGISSRALAELSLATHREATAAAHQRRLAAARDAAAESDAAATAAWCAKRAAEKDAERAKSRAARIGGLELARAAGRERAARLKARQAEVKADRRERRVARGQLVHCTRCWLPLDLESARAGEHQDCVPPTDTLPDAVARTLLRDS